MKTKFVQYSDRFKQIQLTSADERSKKSAIRLSEVARQVYVISYNEDTSELEQSWKNEGFCGQVLRSVYTQKELTYSRSIRCMIGHAKALHFASLSRNPTIICEADFVPCRGIGATPWPVPQELSARYCCWLYSNRPVIFGPIFQHVFDGYSNSPVCYVVSPFSAKIGVEFMESVLEDRDPQEYFDWDNVLPLFLRNKGIAQLITHQCLGEHGGTTNPEHNKNMRFGTSDHRAEKLKSSLHFLPAYANGSLPKFLWVRIRYRCLGIGRALFLRFCRPSFVPRSRLLKSYAFGLARVFLTKVPRPLLTSRK